MLDDARPFEKRLLGAARCSVRPLTHATRRMLVARPRWRVFITTASHPFGLVGPNRRERKKRSAPSEPVSVRAAPWNMRPTVIALWSVLACGAPPRIAPPDGGTPLRDADDEGPIEDMGPIDDAPASCEAAARTRGNLGCDFLAVTTTNPVDPVFGFALVIGNPHEQPVTVTVERDGQEEATARVAARSAESWSCLSSTSWSPRRSRGWWPAAPTECAPTARWR